MEEESVAPGEAVDDAVGESVDDGEGESVDEALTLGEELMVGDSVAEADGDGSVLLGDALADGLTEGSVELADGAGVQVGATELDPAGATVGDDDAVGEVDTVADTLGDAELRGVDVRTPDLG